MTVQQNQDLYTEYCAMYSLRTHHTEQELANNLQTHRQEYSEKLNDSGRHFVQSPYTDYEKKLIQIALANAKSKQEWQDMEADDMRMKATGFMTHKNASELLDRYANKIQNAYKSEKWFQRQIDICNTKISEIAASNMPAHKKENKITHWKSRRTGFVVSLAVQIEKTNRFEFLATKWRGICEQIRLAAIKREIRLEKQGVGNKYGFNPNMQSREDATGVFNEFEY